MSDLLQDFENLSHLAPLPRGRAFERFLSSVFSREGIRNRLSYRPTGEEIDGALWWNHLTFLLEAKWLANPLPASAIYAFKGKVDGKFAGTLGLFVSMSGYSNDCVDAVSHGKNLNILLFDGSDVGHIARGEKFSRVLEEKLFAAGQTGDIYLPWDELKQADDVILSVNQEAADASARAAAVPLIVICEGPTDRIILESLISHVAKDSGKAIEPKFLISHGKTPLLNSLAPSLISLLSNGVSGKAAVLVAFDADTMDPLPIEQQAVRARRMFDDLPPGWQGFVAIASPEIEAWLGLPSRGDQKALLLHLQGLNWNERAIQLDAIAELIRFLRSL